MCLGTFSRRVVFALRSFPRKGLEKYAPFRYNQVIWADFAQIQVDLSKNVATAGDNSKREGIMEIQLQNLTKKFPNRNRKHPGDVIAVNEFNFTIPDGQLIGLLGPSGCGKSTTLNLICGLEKPTSGKIFFGGEDVTGVEPEFFISESFQMEGLTELIVTKDIPERRTKMIELGDAFIAFPGGTGTLEEVSEVMSKLALKQIDAPCVLYNLNGYYEGLKALLRHMVEMGLSTEEKQEKVYFAENLGDIKAILGAEK